MPSPLGHALGGAIVWLAAGPWSGPAGARGRPPVAPSPPAPCSNRSWGPLVLCMAAAVLPDADFLWGRHNMETHSLGAAVLAGLTVLAVTRGRHPRLAVLVATAWASHALFDWLGSDDAPPLGVMALWPLTSDFYFAHAYVFDAISRQTHRPGFWWHNLRAVAREGVLLAPVVAGLWRRRPRAS